MKQHMRLSFVCSQLSTQMHPQEKFTMDVNSRCNCKDRIAEQDMCVHEMVVKGGFVPQLFVERHFQRTCVSGSLNGWIPPPKEKIDEIIGFCPEVLEVTSHVHDIDSSNRLNTADVVNPFLQKNMEGAVPLDYLPDQRASTNPFTKKEVENVLHSVMAGYQNLSISRQHDVSMLVLELQDAMTSDKQLPMILVTDIMCVLFRHQPRPY